MYARILCCLAACIAPWRAVAEEPAVLTEADQKQAAQAKKQFDEAASLLAGGKPAEAKSRLLAVLRQQMTLYAPPRFKNGHADLAQTLQSLGSACGKLGESAKAADYFGQAAAMFAGLYPPGSAPGDRALVAEALLEGGTALRGAGQRAEAVRRLEQALAVFRELPPTQPDSRARTLLVRILYQLGTVQKELGRFDAARSFLGEAVELTPPKANANRIPALNQLGSVQHQLGDYPAALASFTRALEISRSLFGSADHHQTATCINNIGYAQQALGEYSAALQRYQEALAMTERLYPKSTHPAGHASIAFCINNLGFLHSELADYGKSHGYFARALEMRRDLHDAKRFPDGHPDLATALNNMGFVLGKLNRDRQALTYLEESLAMTRRLHMDRAHPDVIAALLNITAVQRRLGERAASLASALEALRVSRAVFPADRYPRSHPMLIACLNTAGLARQAQDEHAAALESHQSALAGSILLYDKDRFPQGHADLVLSRHNCGYALMRLGRHPEALEMFRQAVAGARVLIERDLDLASEYEISTRLRQFRVTLDGFLSSALTNPATAEESFEAVWRAQAATLRVLERRHRFLADASRRTPAIQQGIDRLGAIRRQRARWITVTGADPQRRDYELIALTLQQERAERLLAKAIADVAEPPAPAPEPRLLRERLGADEAFVCYFLSIRYEPDVKDRLRYLAFVVVPGRPTVRVDLGDWQSIDETVVRWRSDLNSGPENPHAARLRTLVWDRIAGHLPPATRTVYLSLDGVLTRLPFAALPGRRPGTVLLEDHAIAVVPGGAWLAQRLKNPKYSVGTAAKSLIVGGVDYGQGSSYPALPHTIREVDQIRAMTGGGIVLTGSAATTEAVRRHLPDVEAAHFATHGFFLQQSIAHERRRLEEYQRTGALTGTSAVPVGAALGEPLGYVGLVCSGANDPARSGPDFGLLTGLDILDRPLSKLRLCVLSACESGIGEVTSAEGTTGLKRAFHISGCDNVVGSLWNVNDAATAALMAKFYHEMWVNKKPPIEALRTAQLTIYHHPELIPDLAGERGAPKLKEALAAAPAKPAASATGENRTPTKLWAAFVLSGVGR